MFFPDPNFSHLGFRRLCGHPAESDGLPSGSAVPGPVACPAVPSTLREFPQQTLRRPFHLFPDVLVNIKKPKLLQIKP